MKKQTKVTQFNYQKAREALLRKIKEKPGSTQSVVYWALFERRRWQDGLTVEELCRLTEKARDKVPRYKKRKVNKEAIYRAKNQINYFKIHGIHIATDYGFEGVENDKVKEWRYFNIQTKDDADATKKKYESKEHLQQLYTENLKEHEMLVAQQAQRDNILERLLH